MHPIFVARNQGKDFLKTVNQISGHIPYMSIVTEDPAVWLVSSNLNPVDEKIKKKYRNDASYTPMQYKNHGVAPLPLENERKYDTLIDRYISAEPGVHALEVQKLLTAQNIESLLVTPHNELLASHTTPDNYLYLGRQSHDVDAAFFETPTQLVQYILKQQQ